MSQNSVRAAAIALRNVHSTAARTATVVPSSLPPFDVALKQSDTSQSDLTRPLQPASTSAPTPTATSFPTALVFEGPSGRQPVVRNYHELMSPRTTGPGPIVTIFEGPTHSSPQWRRPVSQNDMKSASPESQLIAPRMHITKLVHFLDTNSRLNSQSIATNLVIDRVQGAHRKGGWLFGV
ncbi:hypothetical protein C8R45DRAFT_940853 [Mycena sanguinolenta]|nr:hypothetical protein C8R45DRAFT_940853 [Mycena sanguinolenta]